VTGKVGYTSMKMTILVAVASRQRVVIVGGGVLGTMHALAAQRRGFEVTQLEREAEARGASVRNFGLVWVSGRRAGSELALALRARQLWEELGSAVPGLGFRAAGSLTIAADEVELGLLKEAAARPDADRRGFELLDPRAVRTINPALRGDFAGGLYCRLDGIVEPRQVLPALRGYLAASSGAYQWLPGREVTEVTAGAVRDHTGAWHHGDLVVLCTGAAHTGVAGRYLTGGQAAPVRRVRLQMMQTAPLPEKITTALADGDSLRYYPAYELPGRAQLAPQSVAAAQARAQLLLVQRADGGLTIGDTHEYAEPFAFDVDEDAYDHLRARAETLLGGPIPRIQRRWAGVYSEVNPALASDALYHRSEVEPGVVLVTGPGGRGMTCSPAIAEETF
jgi:FAD dependent oxidoreductase TIGR03364